MKNKNTNELRKVLDDFNQNPTYGDALKLSLLISIATSLACIADAVMIEKEVENEEN